MLAWLSAHYGDILVLAVLALIVGGIIWNMIRNKKKGKTGCSGCSGCSSCTGYSSCKAGCQGCSHK